METGDTTAERPEMPAVKTGNHTLVADDIDQGVSQIDCLCLWQFLNHYPRNLNCHHGLVASHMSHPVEPYSLSSVEICSWTCTL